MRLKTCSLAIALLVSFDGRALADRPVIDRFEAVPDCILPDPRAHILSYSASGGVMRVRIDAQHRGGRVRTFYTASSGGTPAPSLGASGIQDPGAAADVEAYLLVATGEGGAEATRRLAFRYRRATFDLLPPVFHLRVTTGSGRLAVYSSHVNIANVDSLSCSFRFDSPIGGVSTRDGAASADAHSRDGPTVRCDIRWSSVRQANAGGTITWTARVTDACTQGRLTRTARVNPIH
jgi:hypothetical protein